jgi:hypothetical protein
MYALIRGSTVVTARQKVLLHLLLELDRPKE